MATVDYPPRSRRKKVKLTLTNETQKTIRALIITLTSMIIVLSIGFLALTSENSQKGYALQQAKLKNENLKALNTSITSKITHSTSFNELEQKDLIEGMKEPETKNFVTDEDNLVE